MSGTTDQVIDDTIGELIADLQGTSLSDSTSVGIEEKLNGMVERLINVRTQLRSGRGDDWIALADPLEGLALAGYRADAIVNKKFTPPNWDFVDETIKQSWRKWALSVSGEM